MAIHEAGHAVAHLHFGLSSITAITIDGPSGGYIEGETDHIDILTEDRVAAVLVIKLAGRAAEEEFLGSVSAGSGGSSESDLAKSTELALAMETALGFSTETPLLYRHTEERTALLTHHSRLADRVNARLENAYRQARDLVRSNRDAVQLIVEALLRYGTLEGQQLEPVLATVRDQIPAGCPR
ncbi:hypothetical protein RFM68_21145 [Mesorhizobium sp. MSK_1335]|uniref:Peptidase M41 domain-containing protein n=1 Tax=Mesorhizobium montanum TaxID=3072323 RepID=A0ABU4ZNQ1_9HYPH|nr:hypothetical protein [Mesorhizobium sp. MSK_1335]MDX8527011.1 hypothetical protein [Mesorhizobium sp. MSK_1335]